MLHATVKRLPSVDELTTLSSAQLAELVYMQAQTIESLQHQLDWFKRQLFGSKSERVIPLWNFRDTATRLVDAGAAVLPMCDEPVQTHVRTLGEWPHAIRSPTASRYRFLTNRAFRLKPSRCRGRDRGPLRRAV